MAAYIKSRTYLLLSVTLLQIWDGCHIPLVLARIIRLRCMPSKYTIDAKQFTLGIFRCWEETIEEAHTETGTPKVFSRRRPV